MFLFREGRRARELWGKTTENDISKHGTGKRRGVRGRENRLSAALGVVRRVSWFATTSMAAKERMILKSLCCP